jgi:hypothetical protein
MSLAINCPAAGSKGDDWALRCMFFARLGLSAYRGGLKAR